MSWSSSGRSKNLKDVDGFAGDVEDVQLFRRLSVVPVGAEMPFGCKDWRWFRRPSRLFDILRLFLSSGYVVPPSVSLLNPMADHLLILDAMFDRSF